MTCAIVYKVGMPILVVKTFLPVVISLANSLGILIPAKIFKNYLCPSFPEQFV